MEEELFENLLAVLVKELLARCKEILETRGTSMYVDKARDAASKTKDLGMLLQRYKREDLLPLAKKLQLSVAQLIRLGSVPSAVQDSEDAYKVVIVEVRAFCQAAKTSGSIESPRGQSPDTRAALTNSASNATASSGTAPSTQPGRGPFLAGSYRQSVRVNAAESPARPGPVLKTSASSAAILGGTGPSTSSGLSNTRSTPSLLQTASTNALLSPRTAAGAAVAPSSPTHTPRSDSSRQSPSAGSSYNALDDLDSLLDKPRSNSRTNSPRAAPAPSAYVSSSTGQDIDLEVCEDDDEEMIRLKQQMAALKLMKEEALAEEELYLEREREELKSEVDARYDSEFDLLRRESDTSVCFTCGQKPRAADPDTLKAVDRIWHKRCWQCFHCKKPIEIGAPFGADGPRVYCERDYKLKFCCAMCGDFIDAEADEDAEGKLYHPDCYIKLLEKREQADKQKEAKQAQEDAEYLEWMKEFQKNIAQKEKKEAETNPTPPRDNTPKPVMKTPTGSTPYTKPTNPNSPPTAVPTTPAALTATSTGRASLSGVPLDPIQAVQEKLKALGAPPNAKSDPAGYKEYMRKKYTLETEENALLLARKRAGGAGPPAPLIKSAAKGPAGKK